METLLAPPIAVVKRNLSSHKDLFYAKDPALQHGFNAANDNLIQVHWTEISKKIA